MSSWPGLDTPSITGRKVGVPSNGGNSRTGRHVGRIDWRIAIREAYNMQEGSPCRGVAPPTQLRGKVFIIRWFKSFFRLKWVSKPPGNSEPCWNCKGAGQWDALYQQPVNPGEETVRSDSCPACAGIGYHFIPENKA